MADQAKTYHGSPCKNCERTLKWRCNNTCVECERARDRRRYTDPEFAERKLARERERYRSLDHVGFYEHQLRNRRGKALRRKAARHGQI